MLFFFSVFPSFYVLGSLTLSLKIFVEVSKADISEGRVPGCVSPKAGNFTSPYTFLPNLINI